MPKKTGISFDDELLERINSELEYGDSRSQWVNEACELRLRLESTGVQIDE